ncbi:MAG: hypothetical protein IPG22_12495 [Acidobacteria bacterium]|nr:hypothetical protein [Acidobacteriota bacterium]
MMNTSTLKRFVSFAACAAAFVVMSGTFSEVAAQRDPFQKPGFMKPKVVVPPKPKPVKVEKPVIPYAPPSVEARIEYFKRLRETAAANGAPMPKVTSVLTLNEMAVTGIFKTPRGYAAIVEATPIKLSYTIYPGEKFFDGQLVAVDENRLVFKKVTKVAEGKFIASVENKGLRQFGAKAETTAAAPPPVDKPAETASNTTASGKDAKPVKPSNPFLSPVDEMNSQPEAPKEPTKIAKKPAKVAKNKK